MIHEWSNLLLESGSVVINDIVMNGYTQDCTNPDLNTYTREAHAYITKYKTVTLETVISLHFSLPKTEQYLRVQ